MTDPRTSGPRNGAPAAGGLVPAGQVPSVKCSAKTSAGRPCKKWAIVGGTVCMTHGGAAPQVRAAANRRLLDFAPQAVQVLIDIARAGESEPSRVRAAIDILDRTVGKSVDVTLDLTPKDAENPRLDAAIANALAARGLGPAPEVLDAEVIEPEEPTSEEP